MYWGEQNSAASEWEKVSKRMDRGEGFCRIFGAWAVSFGGKEMKHCLAINTEKGGGMEGFLRA